MSIGYVEELALRYFQKKGCLVTQNIRFQLDKKKTGKKVSGWSDIDLLVVDQEKILIVQCKSFLGTSKAETSARALWDWFSYAEHFLLNDHQWIAWTVNRKLCKTLVVDCYTPKTEEELMKFGDVEIIRYSDIMKELFRMLSGKYVKEDDPILRLMSALITHKAVKSEFYEL